MLPLPRFPSPLKTWPSCADGPGPAGCRPCSRSGLASCSWRRRSHQHRDRPAGRRLSTDGHCLPPPLHPPRAGRIARPAPAGTTTDRPSSPPGRDLVGHPQPAPASAGHHPLVHPAAGPRARCEPRHHRPHLARVRRPAVAGRDLQVLHRPAAGGQSPRRRRPVPAPTRAGGGPLCGREVADPSLGTHPARAPRLARAARTTHPRLPATWHHATATKSSWPSSSRSPAPTHAGACT
jgi:hypothetical protein